MKNKLILITLLLTGPTILASSGNRLTPITDLFPNLYLDSFSDSYPDLFTELKTFTFNDKPLPPNFVLASNLKKYFYISDRNLFCRNCKKNLFPKNIVHHLKTNCQTAPNAVNKAKNKHQRGDLKKYYIHIHDKNKQVQCIFHVEGRLCNQKINSRAYARHYDNKHGRYSNLLKQKQKGDIAKCRERIGMDEKNREIVKCVCGKTLLLISHNSHANNCATAMKKLKNIIEKRKRK